MRKGDVKRQELLNVADRLFCTKGYEATSVQDILDVLHTSKGGFYHYFVSKESVLDTLCAQRVERFRTEAEAAIVDVQDPVERMNLLLHYFLPLRKEELEFMTMLLPLLGKPESMSVRVRYQDVLAQQFRVLVEDEIDRGYAKGAFHPVTHEVTVPVLTLANACWVEGALLLIESAQNQQPQDPAAMLAVLEKYRRSIEVLLDAPYGSIEMISLEEWNDLASHLLRQLRLPMNG